MSRIPANGGELQLINGHWWFVFDQETHTLITSRMRAKGKRNLPPKMVPAEPIRCGPVPFAPTLGGFTNPNAVRYGESYCTPSGIAQEWDFAWTGLGYGPPPRWGIA